jgi:very-short-patch-repair endonuclease
MPTQRTGGKEKFRQTLVGRARAMRGNLTGAELKLWDSLRGDQLPGLRFRRQHRLGSYIADFFCHAAKLVVEVDGDSHDERQEYDEKRTHWMSQHKRLRVVRYTNEDVMKNLDAALENIAALCANAARPSPQPSPRSTGKREQEEEEQP